MNEVTCFALGTCGQSIVVLFLCTPDSELPRTTISLPHMGAGRRRWAGNPFVHSTGTYYSKPGTVPVTGGTAANNTEAGEVLLVWEHSVRARHEVSGSDGNHEESPGDSHQAAREALRKGRHWAEKQ